jgi:enamine deaminase RidA (YjgF/YER057c/UK114 family)
MERGPMDGKSLYTAQRFPASGVLHARPGEAMAFCAPLRTTVGRGSIAAFPATPMRMLFPALIATLLASGCATTPPASTKTIVIPAGTDAAYDTWHYAPAVRVGDTVYVSGIPAGPGDDYDTRIRNMFKRLKHTLEAAGASMEDVVEITSFHRQPTDTASFDAEFEHFFAIHKEYFPSGYPASTMVGTTALLAEGAPVELRAVAVVGAGKHLVVQRATSRAPM